MVSSKIGGERMLAKAYVEITNCCNLRCAFCPGTKRAARFMTPEEFALILQRLRGHTRFIYLHLMGEPLLHSQLTQLLELAHMAGFQVGITTNGTLLPRLQPVLTASQALRKVNVSLHSFEANDGGGFDAYLTGCTDFARAAAAAGIYCNFRLWNLDGETAGLHEQNERVLAHLRRVFPAPWADNRHGQQLADHVFLQWGERFEWPDLQARDRGQMGFCYGLRNQIGVLCDGTVVPCCLDHEGDLPLGNLLLRPLEEILHSPAAEEIYHGFTARRRMAELCRRCGYADRFQK